MSRTPEDLLRDALRDDTPVGAGSFDDVRARAHRMSRRSRMLKAGAAVVVVLAAIGVSITVLRGDGDKGQPVITKPSPDITAKPVEGEQGIWPFATAAQADDDRNQPLGFEATDPVATAEIFLKSVVGMALGDVSSQPEGKHILVVDRLGSRTTTVELAKLGSSGRWTVVAAYADGLVLDSVDVSASSVRLSGRATAFEGTVDFRLVDRGLEPKNLGEGVLTGEMGELKPFNGDIAFQPDSSGLGAVIAVTRSAKDGLVEQVAAAPIRWAPETTDTVALPAGQPLADDELVAVVTTRHEGDPDTQQVAVIDNADGTIRRNLGSIATTAEGGILDLDVSADRRTVLVALSTSACTSEVRAYAADGSSMKVFGVGESVALSPNGRWLATTVPPPTSECGVAHRVIALTDLLSQQPTTRFDDSPADNSQITQMTWIDDERLAFQASQETSHVRVLSVRDGTFRTLAPEPDEVWSLPSRTSTGQLTVYACCAPDGGSIELLDRDGTRTRTVAKSLGEVFSYTYSGGVLYYLGKGGEFRTSIGRLLRHDIAIVAA